MEERMMSLGVSGPGGYVSFFLAQEIPVGPHLD